MPTHVACNSIWKAVRNTFSFAITCKTLFHDDCLTDVLYMILHICSPTYSSVSHHKINGERIVMEAPLSSYTVYPMLYSLSIHDGTL